MSGELLRLSEHEALRVISEGRDEVIVEATWRPGGSPPPPHMHPAQDEDFEVHKGRLTAIVDGVKRTIGPGDTLHIPRRTTHKMWNADEQTVTALWRTRPGGRTADWFRTVDRLGAGGMRRRPVRELAKALTEYADVFQLVIGPRPARPLLYLVLRILALLG